MALYVLAIPLTTERLGELQRLVKSPDYNIEIYLSGIAGDNQAIIDSLREVLVQALIACDGECNGSRN